MIHCKSLFTQHNQHYAYYIFLGNFVITVEIYIEYKNFCDVRDKCERSMRNKTYAPLFSSVGIQCRQAIPEDVCVVRVVITDL